MASKIGVLLVTRDLATKKSVASVLDGSKRFEVAGVCRGLEELVGRLEHSPVPAVLVDIDPQPELMLGKLEEIISHSEGSRFVVLAGDRRDDLVLEAMQVGARYFLEKACVPMDLEEVVQRIIARDGGGEREGSLITVLSASGGCGATTLAVNLANEVHLATTSSTLLIDLDVSYGGVAAYLGIDGEYGIADLLASQVAIDSDLVRTTALTHSENLDVLLSPVSINFSHPLPVNHDHVEEALTACKSIYDCTIVDAPRISMDLAAALARVSRLVLIVFQLSVKDMQTVREMLDALMERDVDLGQVVGLANRYRKRGQAITIEEAQKVLSAISLGTITNDYRSASLGINYGKPLAQVAPRSVLRRDIEALAATVSNPYATYTSSAVSR